MKTRTRNLLLFCTLMCSQTVLLLSGQASYAKDKIQAAQRIPADTLLYVSIPDIKTLVKQYKKSSAIEMAQDEAFGDIVQEMITKFKEASKGFEQETDLSLKSVLNIPSGEISLAVFKTQANKFGGVVFMEYGESGDVFKKFLAKSAERLEEEATKHSTKNVEGTEIIIYSFEETRANQGPDEIPIAKKYAYFLKDKTFVASNDDKVLESVLSNWDGQENKTLAGKKEYQYILNKCAHSDEPPVFHWYLNPIDALKSVVGIAGKSNPQVAMFQGFLPALGLSSLKGVGGTWYLATKDFETVTKTFTYVEKPTHGIISVFKCPAVAQQPPWWVSDKAAGYFSVNWGIDGAYHSIETLFDGFQGRPGAMAAAIDKFADDPNGPKIHIKKDIVDNLTGQIQLVSEYQENSAAELLFGNYTVALGLKKPEAVKKLVTSLTSRGDFPGKSREFQGTTVYELPGPLLSAAFCITENQLIFTTNIKQIEKILRKDRGVASLVNDEIYKRISETFPEKTSIISYQRVGAQLKALYKSLMQKIVEMKPDNSELPDRAVLAALEKYLPITGGYTIPDEQGFLSVTFTVIKGTK